LIKYKLILGQVQHIALLSNLYVSFSRLPNVVLLSFSSINAALQFWALLLSLSPAQICLQQHIYLSDLFSRLNTRDER